MAQNIAVMDIGSSKITVLIGERGVNNTICVQGMGSSSYAGFADGKFLRPKNIGVVAQKAITQAQANAGRQIDKLYIGVPAYFAKTRCKEVSASYSKKHKITSEDVDELHKKGTEFNEPDCTLINSQPIFYIAGGEHKTMVPEGLTANKLSGFISYTLAENYFINLFDEIMENVDIPEYDYLSSNLAESLYLFDEVERDGCVVLIDVGYIVTYVSVIKGDGILRHFSIPLGGGHIVQDLSTYLDIKFNMAEKLKRMVNISLEVDDNETYAVEVKDKMVMFEANKVNEVVTTKLRTLARVIRKRLSACDYPDSIPYYFTGGGISYIGGARMYLGKLLEHEARQAYPKMPQYKQPHLSSLFGMMDMVLNAEKESPTGIFQKLFGR